MRFIIRELPYEKAIAAGQLRYSRNGQRTGATESWRLTSATTGYRFLRVDLDARQARSGASILYHLVLNQAGRLERLAYRAWSSAAQVKGNVLLENGIMTRTHELNGVRREESIPFKARDEFWFPSAIGLGLLARCARSERSPERGSLATVTLDVALDGNDVAHEDAFAFKRLDVHMSTGSQDTMQLMGASTEVYSLDIAWQDQAHRLWLDQHDWPVKMKRGDGLMALEERYIRYR